MIGIDLVEGKQKKLIIVQGETQYFRISTDKKSSPLAIGVKISEGLCSIYASSEICAPNRANAEYYWERISALNLEDRREEYFIDSKYKRFQTGLMYLSIIALEHTVLIIDIKFGGQSKGNESLGTLFS